MSEWKHCPDCGLALNDEPNTVRWSPGALVIHDKDAKQSDMLMVVLGYSETGECRTVYINEKFKRAGSVREWWNPLCALHDPKRFNIPLPQRS